LVTCGGRDLEGSRLAPDDGIGDDLHAAHLHWVVQPLLCQKKKRTKSSSEQARPHNPAETNSRRGHPEARLLQYSTAVAVEPEGRRRRSIAAAARRRRKCCLVAIAAGGALALRRMD